jgi:ribulose 1,5-bisphosphate synthetase/thiazole synthase
MKNTDPTFERKVLLDVVEQLKDPDQTMRKQTRLKRAIYGAGSLGLVIAFILAMNDLAHIIVTTFIAGMAGSAVGFALFLDFAQKQWPVTMKHIDMGSVEARLDELDI